jgi:hypothetical protein
MGQVLHEDVMQILAAVGMYVRAGTNDTPQSPDGAKALALLKDAMQKLCPFGRPEKPDEPVWRGRGCVMEPGLECG